ncbi:MAG TPA: ATP-binding cassette domain-containing protein, partial [Thermoanaerobaculia bacterium]|nr:ATP-binding cassette domain-containing protein [Thermoanaerobaculia bacterium]
MRLLRNLFRILSASERRQVLLLTPLLCLSALVEVVGIASITPFLAIVADPEAVERHEILSRLYELGGFDSSRQFLIALGTLMFLVIVGSNCLTALSTWAVLRFSWMRNHSIAIRLLRSYLDRPYVYFLERHSSDLAKNLVAEVHQVVAGTIVPAMKSAAKAIAAVAILGLLFAIDPWLAALTTGVLSGAYALIFLAVRRNQLRMGKERLSANKGRFQVLAETFGGIKEVKLLAREDEAMRRFSGPSFAFARATARNAVVAQIPRYALEAVAFGGIVLIVLYVIGTGREFGAILPILGLYAFAGYRLMPALQQIFQGLTNVRFNSAALDNLIADLGEPRRPPRPRAGDEAPLRLTRSLRFRRVSFRYPSAPEPLFEDLDLEIAAGTSTALVGETGSGKSTLADLVLGLLRPDSGWLEVDGVPITEENLRRWQSNLGYVPQSIFLTDDTVARNIAFGLPDDRVDRAAVERAA